MIMMAGDYHCDCHHGQRPPLRVYTLRVKLLQSMYMCTLRCLAGSQTEADSCFAKVVAGFDVLEFLTTGWGHRTDGFETDGMGCASQPHITRIHTAGVPQMYTCQNATGSLQKKISGCTLTYEFGQSTMRRKSRINEPSIRRRNSEVRARHATP